MSAFSIAVLPWTVTLIIVTDAVVLNMFGTKNTYNASLVNSSLSDDDLAVGQNCRPLQVIVLMRHGIRYPGADDIEAAHRIVHQFQRRGAKSALVDQLDVSRYLPIKMAKQLSITGAEEQFGLGSRAARRYFELFSSAEYEAISLVTSSFKRAKDSGLNFGKGFVESLGFNISRSIETRDDLLRFFDLCPKYIKEVDKNKTALREEELFRNMTRRELNSNIAKYLNISELNISADDLDSLYKVAASEVAIVRSHYWTDLLSISDLDLLEYSNDLDEYWKLGYGYPINYQQSCPLLADIFHHLDDTISGRRTKKGVFYFGHAETLLPLTSLLGLFKDNDQLRADNYNSQHNRAFKSSRISSFSANVGFALYKCKSTETDPQAAGSSMNKGYMVQVLFNEQPIQLPPVCTRSICSYDALRKYYSEFIDGCDFNATCSLPSSAAIPNASMLQCYSRVYTVLSLSFLLLMCIVTPV